MQRQIFNKDAYMDGLNERRVDLQERDGICQQRYAQITVEQIEAELKKMSDESGKSIQRVSKNMKEIAIERIKKSIREQETVQMKLRFAARHENVNCL